MSLLTIAIPTYNRKIELYKCLDSLCKEINNINGKVDILISDNASNYDIMSVINNFKKTNIRFEIIINDLNIGMTKNFLQCLTKANGEYIWLYSDDEYINEGTLSAIVKELEIIQPDYVYLSNSRVKKNRNIKRIDVYSVNRDEMIYKAGVYQTLITSNIFKRDLIQSYLDKEYNTLFPHTQIFYDVLKNNDKFMIIDGDLFQGTPNNSGGYSWFQAFVVDLTNVIKNNDIVSKHNRRKLEKELIRMFYFKKFLSLSLKNELEANNLLSNYHIEDIDEVYSMIKERFSSRVDFWVFIFPLHLFPPILLKSIYNFVIKYIMPIYRKRY